MSVEAMAVVLHHSRASGTDKLVLLGIANHDGDGGAFPSIATLAKYANVTERTVQRSIDTLVTMGELHVHRQAGGTHDMQPRHRPNRYDILVTCPANCDRTKHHRLVEPGVTPASPRVARRGDVCDRAGVTPASPKPDREPDSGYVPGQTDRQPTVADVGRSVVDVALAIVAERHRERSPRTVRNPQAWKAGVVANLRREHADVIAAAVAEGCDAVTIAGRILGSQVIAEVTASRMNITPPEGDPT